MSRFSGVPHNMTYAIPVPLKILLVDDNPDDRTLVIRELGREFTATQVTEVTDQKRFDQALEDGNFDLIITDYHLCWSTGLDILRVAKSRWPDCPIVMFTGTGSEEIAVEAIKNGLDDYVLKSSKHYGRLPSRVRLALEQSWHKRQLRDTEDELRATDSLLHAIIEAEPDCVKIVGEDCKLRYINATGMAMLEADSIEHVLGKNVLNLISPEHRQAFQTMNEQVIKGAQGMLEFEITGLKGGHRWLETHAARLYLDEVSAMLCVTRDISERKRQEAKLVYLANYNALTGLPNRTLLTDRLEQALIEARRHDRLVALVFLDMDRFKHITESLGHELGDMVLKKIAEQLTGLVREGDTVAHPGGDEFILMFSDVAHSDDVTRLVQKVLCHFENTPLIVGEHRLYLTASAGISIFPSDGNSADGLMQGALAAMYRSQALGGNTYQFYSSEMNSRALENLSLGSDLHDAIARNEIELHYQPQVELSSGRIVGMEALARWRHPRHGLVPPGVFIPLAEETGLIGAIGAWVLREACRQNKAWQDEGLTPIRVAVNLSARQFWQQDIVNIVSRIVADTELDPRFLELEITESMLMQDLATTINIMQQLKEIGISFSLDDFGTGYSSLSYLKRFPIETLKIDKSFVRDIPQDKDDSAIASAIIAMSSALDIKVIAEGVETPEQLTFLHNQKCAAIQGYYFSKPLPANEIRLLMQQGKTL